MTRAAQSALLGVTIALAVAAAVVVTRAGGSDPPAGPGRDLYAANCASCHGARGEGAANWKVAGTNGTFPPPPHNGSGHTWHHPDGLLLRIVRDGCAAYATGDTPCNMPAFGGSLAEDEMRAIIDFIRHWWSADQREFQRSVSEDDPFP